MSFRHKGRELAMQVLFQWDIHQGQTDWLQEFWKQYPVNSETRAFADRLITGVMTHAAELDALIGRYAEHWTVARMAFIDRGILRMAVYELLNLSDIPPRVTLNEAIDIAKRFGDDQSGAFVNGILDRILKEEPQLRSKAADSVQGVAHD
jgi:transcription antitermination protein NusB